MQFNQHQARLWSSMLKFIKDFREGKLTYSDLIGKLEGTLYAGEFKDEELIEKWYELWGKLELWNAAILNSDVTGYIFNIEDVNQDLTNMELFLKKILIMYLPQ